MEIDMALTIGNNAPLPRKIPMKLNRATMITPLPGAPVREFTLPKQTGIIPSLAWARSRRTVLMNTGFQLFKREAAREMRKTVSSVLAHGRWMSASAAARSLDARTAQGVALAAATTINR